MPEELWTDWDAIDWEEFPGLCSWVWTMLQIEALAEVPHD